MQLTNRLNNSHVLRTYLNMIRTAPIDIVMELKQNLENEPQYQNHKHYTVVQQEFTNRLNA